MNKDSKKSFNIDMHLASISREEIKIPTNLASNTAEKLKLQSDNNKNLFPYILGAVFTINILVSLLFGGVLFLMRPISLLEWIIIGSIYSTVNAILYAITFINYEKIQNVLKAYSAGGK